jgi:hypothetical protein
MSTKTKIALAAAVALSVVSAARANEGGEEKGGGPVQTWQDIEQSRQFIQKEIKSQYHTDTPDSAYGYVAPASQTRRPSPEQARKR